VAVVLVVTCFVTCFVAGVVVHRSVATREMLSGEVAEIDEGVLHSVVR
jgi:hypothetical protein